MNIQNVFSKQSQLFLNSSLLALIPAAIFILLTFLGYIEGKYMLFVLPFFIYSFILFQNYLLNYKRTIRTENMIHSFSNNKIDFLSYSQYIFYFSKEERELLFFHPNGILLGKLVEKNKKKMKNQVPKQYELVDLKENVIATYYRNKETIDVYLNGYGYFGSFLIEKKGHFILLSGEIIGDSFCRTGYMDDCIKNNLGEVLMRVRKGIMPTEFQQVFLNPNSPIMTFESPVEYHHKLLYLSLLVKRFF